MNNKFELWLDLEGTIIDDWYKGNLFLGRRIKDFTDEHKISKLNIFSFAIQSVFDQEKFVSRGMKKMIEDFLEVEILNHPSVPDMMRKISPWEKLKYDDMFDFMSINCKHWAFIKYIQAHSEFNNQHFVLIDDMVDNMEILIKDRNLKIELIDVRKMV